MAAKPCNTSTARRRHSGWARSRSGYVRPRPKDPKRSAEHANGPAHDPPRPPALGCCHGPGSGRGSRARPRLRCRPPGRRRQATTGSASAGSRSRHCSTVISRSRLRHVLAAGKDAAELLRAVRPDGPIRTPVNAFAVNTGERLYLVDSGTAGGFAPGVHLPEALAAAGLPFEAVDAVILTIFMSTMPAASSGTARPST